VCKTPHEPGLIVQQGRSRKRAEVAMVGARACPVEIERECERYTPAQGMADKGQIGQSLAIDEDFQNRGLIENAVCLIERLV